MGPVSHFARKQVSPSSAPWVHLRDQMRKDRRGVVDRRKAWQHSVKDYRKKKGMRRGELEKDRRVLALALSPWCDTAS